MLPSIPRAPEPIRPAPLSFAPTPLSREASANGRTDGETAPGALVVSEDRRVEPAVGGLPTDTVILDQRGALVPEDTQPRVVLGTVEPGLARVDTQPRVVVGTLLEEPVAETALEELPEDAFGEAVEPPADEAIPTGPIAPLQRPASAGEAGPPAPRRRLLGWTLAVTAGLAVAAAALWAWERYGVEAVLGPDPLQAERAEPSAPPPAEAPVLAGEQADAAVSGAQVAATKVPDASDTVGAAAAAPDASVTPEASAEVETDAGLAAPVELAAVAQDAGADLLEPLTLQPDPATLVQEAAAKEPAPATRPAVAKRPERPRTQRASPELKRLRQEWAEAQKQFRLLKRDYTCDVRPMKMVCFRMDELEEQLRQTGDEPQEIAALRRRVRVLRYEMRGLTRAGD